MVESPEDVARRIGSAPGPGGESDTMTRSKSRKHVFSMAIGLLAVACSTPVGIRTADPVEVHRYLTRNALTDE